MPGQRLALGARVLFVLALLAIGGSFPALAQDCNTNGVDDATDIALGTSDDCNANGIPDECDIGGVSSDANLNGIPDECEPVGPFDPVPVGGYASADAVAISGDVAVVGSPLDSGGATSAGAAHVFRRVGTIWVEEAVLLASDAATGDLFGASISVDGTRIAVGAPGADLTGTNEGAVYIFEFSVGVWSQTDKLTLAVPASEDALGTSVSLLGSRVLAGAPMTAAVSDTGQAVVFFDDGVNWTEEANLVPAGLAAGDHCGSAVSLSATHAFVGAPGRTSGVTPGAGEVFAYALSGTWSLSATLAAPLPETGAQFGATVAGTDVSLAVGAPGQATLAGAIHVFENSPWIHTQELASPLVAPTERFGLSVAMSDTFLVVGEAESPATEIGSAHVYSRNAGAWTYDATLRIGGLGDLYGESVGTDGRYAIVGSAGLPGATVHWIEGIPDCNGNSIDDTADIAQGTEVDCNLNGIPDSCDGLVDIAAPVFSNVPTDFSVGTSTSSCDAMVVWTPPTVTDDCLQAVTVTSTHVPGAIFPIGDTTVVYTATDTTGNSSTASFVVSVVDDDLPFWTFAPVDLQLNTDAGLCSAIATWIPPTANDNCAVQSTSSTALPGDVFPVGTTTVTYAAFDPSGNVGTVSFDVTVIDNEAPVFGPLPSPMIDATGGTCDALATWTDPVVTDNCPGVMLTSDIVSGTVLPVGSTIVTYTATDASGNVTVETITVEVLDATPPTLLDVPGDIALTAEPLVCSAAATWTEPTSSDDCGGTNVTSSHAPGSTFPVGATVVTYTATDTAGNTTQGSFTVTVTDDEDPTWTFPPGDQVALADPGACGTVVSWTPPSPNDNCAIDTATASHDPGDFFDVGMTVVTYTATDFSGNIGEYTFTVTVSETEPPTISGLPASFSVDSSAGTCDAVASWADPTADDNCGVLSLTSDVLPGSTLPVGDTLVTYTATDVNGNVTTESFTVTVVDATPPALISVPANITVPADAGQCTTAVNWTPPIGADDCGGVTVSGDRAPGSTFSIGATLVTYTATDDAGNQTTASFTVTVEDVQPPVITGAPTNMAISNDPGLCSAVVTWTPPTATDLCTGATLVPTALPGDTFPVGTTTVTYTATDGAGNEATASFDVVVTDIEDPVISALPADIVLSAAPGTCDRVVTWTEPTASDNCGIASFGPDIAPGSLFPVGTTSVAYTALDAAGNSHRVSFDVTIIDDQLPTIGLLNGDLTVSATIGSCSATVGWLEPNVDDNCGAPTVDVNLPPGSNFPVGATTVTYTATDVNGNVAMASFLVTVTDDEPPLITGTPTDIITSAAAGTCAATVNWAAPAATDNCSVASLTPDVPPGSSFPVGVTTVTYTATDASGNTVSQGFDITVTDDEAPVIIGLPSSFSIDAEAGVCEATVMWTEPSAVDNCSLASFGSDVASGSVLPVGTTSVTYTAVDADGNITSQSFTVTVLDSEFPIIAGTPADIFVSALPGACAAPVIWTEPTASDNCSVASLVTTATSGSSFPVGTTTVTYTATDSAGNVTTSGFDVTVTDDEAPVISGVPANIVASADPGTCATVVSWTDATATDNCGTATIDPDILSGTSFPVGVTTVVYTATDPAGNASTAPFDVTVTDDEDPVIVGLPTDISATTPTGESTAVVTWTEPTASDNCTLASLVSDISSGSSFPVGVTAVTYIATDQAGNVSAGTFNVSVTDNEAPVITNIPANIVIPAEPGLCSAVATWTEPIATDNNILISLTSNWLSGSVFPVGVTTVIYTALDDTGNTSTASFTVTVLDEQFPTITGTPSDISVVVALANCAEPVSWTEPTADDNCSVGSFGPNFPPGTAFPVGVTAVVYSAVDPAGNLTQTSFTVTVEDLEDPVISGTPADLLLSAAPGTCAATGTWTEPTSTDNCTVASFAPSIPSGSSFPVGTTTVTYTAVDASGNNVSSSFDVMVTDDESPIISNLPANVTLTADPGTCEAFVTWTEPTATDNCTLSSFTADAVSGTNFSVGVTPVTYTAIDQAGNFTTRTFVVSVTDIEDPVIAGLPSNINANVDPGLCTTTVVWSSPSANDNCGISSFTSNLTSGASFSVGVTPVTYIATDTAGNSTSGTFLVIVSDDEAPVISGIPADIVQSAAASQCGAIVTWPEPTATDTCGTVTLGANRPSGSSFPVGQTTVTYTATDGVNISIATFQVTVVDAQAPMISGLPLDFTVSAFPGTCGATVSWPTPNATDNCTLTSLTSDRISGATFPVGVTTVTYTATDAAGNLTTADFTFTVTDDQDPVISGLPSDIVVMTSGGLCTATASWTEPTATDSCGVPSLSGSAVPGSTFPLGITPVTYVATDASGNSVAGSFDVIVLDGEAPALSGVPADIAVTTDPGTCSAVVTWPQPTAVDSCSPVTVSSSVPSGTSFSLGTTTVVYTASDGTNDAIASFTVTVTDGEAPTFSNVPSDIVVSAVAGTCAAPAVWLDPLAADNCTLGNVTKNFPSGASFPVGINTVTYTANDAAGNVATASFDVIVTDDQAPSISGLPSDVTVFTTGGLCEAIATWTAPTASDNCGTANLTSNQVSGNTFPVGVTTVTYTATDPAGNSTGASFTVTVIDGDAPVISGVPSDIVQTAAAGQCGAVVSWTAPTATDACTSASISADLPSGSFFPVGTTTVTFTATDGGNSSTASFEVTVTDDEAPSISGLPAPVTVSAEPGACSAPATWTAPSASDNCTVDSFDPDIAPGSTFAVGTTTVTYTATDTAGNSVIGSFDVVVTDDEAPVISGVPTDVTVFTTGGLCTAPASWAEPTAADNCGSASLSGDATSGASFPVGVTTVTYTSDDGAGNVSSASFTVTVIDGDAPVINGLPADIVVANDLGTCGAAVSWTEPTATDACATATLSSDFPNGGVFPVGTTMVTYTATDGGNSSTGSFLVTVEDSEVPTISGTPIGITVSALPGSCAAPAIWVEPTGSDNCALASLTPDLPSGTSFAVGTTTVTYTATDGAGNQSTSSFTVTVTDDQDPVIVGLPTGIVESASPGVGSSIVTWTAPTTTDNCGTATLTSTHAPGDSFPIGVTTVTYTATDPAGNSVSGSFTVTVSDNESPVITGLPANILVPADPGTCSAVVSWTEPTAFDNGVLTSFTSTHLPGDSFPVGVTTVTYTAVDDSANVTTASFTVTVTDEEAPTITGLPADIVTNASAGTCSTIVNWVPPTASDNCALDVFTTDVIPGSSFTVGVTTVTYTAVDDAGNSTISSFTVTVLDAQNPVISGVPANIVVNTAGGLCTAGASWVAPVAFDNCSVASLSASATSGDAFPVGVTTVTYTAMDDSGNTTMASFTVTVVDADAPVLSGVPANIITPNDPGACGALVSWTEPTATDACGSATVTSDIPNGASFPVGTTLVTFTATDGANSSSASFTVTVTDDEDPVISGLPTGLTVPSASGLCAASVTWTAPTAIDNCSISSLSSNVTPGSVFPIGTTTVVYVAADNAGNTSTKVFNVTVVDAEAPVINGIPGNLFLTTAGGLCSATGTWSAPSATDNCTVASLTANFPPGTSFPVGVTTVTYTASDNAGNMRTASFTVTVSDGDAPVISGMPANISVSSAPGTCGAPVSWTPPTAADACGTASLSPNFAPGSIFPVGTTTVTYTASDGANASMASFLVTVTDDEDPTISGLPSNTSVPAAIGGCSAPVLWIEPSVSDNCPGAEITANIAPGTVFPLGNTPVTYIATDDAGNSTLGTFIVTVFDAEAPVISGTPSNIVVTAAPGLCSQNVSWVPPTATDVCGSANLSSSIPPGASFPAGTTTVTYTAIDPAGNSSTSSFDVTVVDQAPPTLLNPPASQVLTVDPGQCTAVAIWSEPVAIDSCGGVTVESDFAPGFAFPIGATAVTYTATDLSGNVSTATFVITVIDNAGPTASGVPSDIVRLVDPGICGAVVTWTEPTFSDGCGVNSVSSTHSPGETFPLGTTTVVYTASDPNGNSTVVSFAIVVNDFVGPTIVGLPSDIVVPNTSGNCTATVNWTAPTASDSCGVASLSSNFTPGSVLAAGVTTVTYTATDTNGNQTTASFTITIQDLVPPSLVNVPTSFTVPSAPGFCGTVPVWDEPLPVDNCGISSFSSDIPLGSFFPVGTTTVNYQAVDLNGNVASASFDITVEDVDAPVFSGVPADIVLDLGPGSCTEVVSWTEPIAGDPCGLVSTTSDLSPGATLGAGTTVVTYTATDVNGNVAEESFTITVNDPEPPVITGVPTDIAVDNDSGLCGANVSWTPPTSSDNCSGAAIESDASPGDFFPIGQTLVTYTAMDDSGNTATASFTVTVTDTEAPTIPDLPVGLSINTANNQCQAFAVWTPPVGADNCGVASIVGSHQPGTVFPVGVTDVTYTVTDVNGLQTTLSFPVAIIDDDAPTISALPILLNVQANPGVCGAVVTWPAPIVNDNCSVVDVSSTAQSGDLFPIGTTVVTYTATDPSGNQGIRTLTITVTDSQLPQISGVPGDIVVPNNPGQCFATVSWTPPTASDNCALTFFVATNDPGDLFPIGQTIVSYTAQDENGNVAQASFLVTVTDVELPSLQIGGDIDVSAAPGECTSTINVPLPSASDNCNLISVTNDYNSTGDASDVYPLGTTTVTWTAIDENGNVSTASQDITVNVALGDDCNGNGISDECDIALGTSADCNSNGIPDECDIADGTEVDDNGNGVIDACEAIFRRGDINDDSSINIADGIFLLQTLFVGGAAPSCADAADANDDGFLDISDVIYEIAYIFTGGPAPTAPFFTCGLDPTGGDSLDCASFNNCP